MILKNKKKKQKKTTTTKHELLSACYCISARITLVFMDISMYITYVTGASQMGGWPLNTRLIARDEHNALGNTIFYSMSMTHAMLVMLFVSRNF